MVIRGKDEGRSQQSRSLQYLHSDALSLAASHRAPNGSLHQHMKSSAFLPLHLDEISFMIRFDLFLVIKQ